MTRDSDLPEKAKFEIALKGKRYGGELRQWAIRDFFDATGTPLGSLAYGYLNGHRSWRTSKVAKVSEYDNRRYVETQNSYYLLAGEPADEATKEVLYNTLYG